MKINNNMIPTRNRTSGFIHTLALLSLLCDFFVDGLFISSPRPAVIAATTTTTTTASVTPTKHHARRPSHLLEETVPSSVSYSAITTSSFSRRSILERSVSFVSSSLANLIGMIGGAVPAFAVEDAQFVEVGQQERPPNGETPFITLTDGVQIKDFRVGRGGGGASSGSSAVVRVGSRVELTMKGRLLNLNGVIFYDTKENDPNGFGEGSPLVFTVGSNTVLPGLESGIIGMTKGGIRRIIVPANVGYGAYPTLEPQPLSEMGKRALESVTKNSRRDQTILFDVRLDRVK
jgi:hypothetical protein